MYLIIFIAVLLVSILGMIFPSFALQKYSTNKTLLMALRIFGILLFIGSVIAIIILLTGKTSLPLN